MGRLKKLFLYALFSSAIISFGATYYFYTWLHRSIASEAKQEFIDYYVPHGYSFSRIMLSMSRQHIISYPRVLMFYAFSQGKNPRVKYGTYRLFKTDTPAQVLQKLIQGNTVVMKVTIPEGWNMYQIAKRLEELYPTVTQVDWLRLFHDKELIRLLKCDELQLTSLEGFLYPDTYFFDPHPEPVLIVKTMVGAFQKYIGTPFFEKAQAMGLTPVQFITLASIVEKETGLKSERSMVAGVYWNRLKLGMRLQADPTVIYGVWDRYSGTITRQDLLTVNSYNTYVIAGLPVGPIASPGIESALAVLQPAKTDALYFVASGYGGHLFSSTLKSHDKAVKRYRQIRDLKTRTVAR